MAVLQSNEASVKSKFVLLLPLTDKVTSYRRMLVVVVLRRQKLMLCSVHDMSPSSLLCTDSARNYIAFAKMKGLHHEVINVHKGIYVRKGVYHVQHVNSYHKRLKKWMERFQGVATKYLDNYLFWFRFLERYKHLSPYEAKRAIIRDMSKESE